MTWIECETLATLALRPCATYSSRKDRQKSITYERTKSFAFDTDMRGDVLSDYYKVWLQNHLNLLSDQVILQRRQVGGEYYRPQDHSLYVFQGLLNKVHGAGKHLAARE